MTCLLVRRAHARVLAHVLAGALAASLVPALALAAPPASQAPLSQSLTGAARDAYASAEILSRNQDFAGALSKYRQAYELSKDPRLLFNMALCERSLHAYARMQSLLLQYKREAGPAIGKDDKADVDAALVAIQRLVGSVKLAVNEAGASVSVDGEAVGTTPLALPLVLDLGAHTLVVTKPGFDDVTQAVRVDGGAEVPLPIQLVERKHIGRLVVSSDDGATVFVDEAVAGRGKFEGTLPAGTHSLRVTESNHRPYALQLELHDGETRTVQVTLEAEKSSAPIWPWIVGGVVVAAGATVGGYFLFRSSSPEAPPASGTFGNVQLTSAWGR
jgi:hypothetical protein